MEPFELDDKKQPGVRKIVVFFLVDPNQRVLSTADIPPQQRAWFEMELAKLPAMQRFPAPLQRIMFSYLDPLHPITLEKAHEFREQLMAERSVARDAVTNTVFERAMDIGEDLDLEKYADTYNMCEH